MREGGNMEQELYQRLLRSLAAGEYRIDAGGAEIAVRDCFDRIPDVYKRQPAR